MVFGNITCSYIMQVHVLFCFTFGLLPCTCIVTMIQSLRYWASYTSLSGYLSFFACATKLSMTCSNASLSPSALSKRFCQYSKTSFALICNPFKFSTCASNSSFVKFCSAASVVAQSIVVELMSSSGGGGGPFLF